MVEVVSLLNNQSHKNPNIPAIAEVTMMEIFDSLIVDSSKGKARLVIKIDIVKPIPPKRPAPIRYFQFNWEGSFENPSLIAK